MKKLTKKTAKQIAKKQLKMRNKLIRQQYSRVRKVFRELGLKVEISTTFVSAAAFKAFEKRLYSVFRVGVEQTIKETSEFLRTVRGVDKSLIPTVQNKALKKLSKEVTAKKVTNITETTRKKINTIITNGQEAGKNIKDIAKEIQKSVNGMSKNRAMRIARTETAQTSTVTYHTGLVEAGFEKTWWHVGGGKQDRESHLACDGETIKADEVFSCGLMHPHDPNADAGEIINCHCELV